LLVQAYSMRGEFLDDLCDQIELRGLTGVRPECHFYIRPADNSTYIEVFFLKEKWIYEVGPARLVSKRISDLAIRVSGDLERWINRNVYGRGPGD